MEDKFDRMYESRFNALQKKYEAEIAIAKTEFYVVVYLKGFVIYEIKVAVEL